MIEEIYSHYRRGRLVVARSSGNNFDGCNNLSSVKKLMHEGTSLSKRGGPPSLAYHIKQLNATKSGYIITTKNKHNILLGDKYV